MVAHYFSLGGLNFKHLFSVSLFYKTVAE